MKLIIKLLIACLVLAGTHPHNTNVFVAAFSALMIESHGTGQILRTVNGGRTWEPVSANNADLESLAMPTGTFVFTCHFPINVFATNGIYQHVHEAVCSEMR
jgi:hypothetical protein